MARRETGRNGYQYQLKKKLEELLPGCLVVRNDPSVNFQGIPDLLVLLGGRWAALEVKANDRAKKQPNQEYYIELMDDMSFAAIIFPENEQEVLRDLQRALKD